MSLIFPFASLTHPISGSPTHDRREWVTGETERDDSDPIPFPFTAVSFTATNECQRRQGNEKGKGQGKDG